jgi:hypothetical protein
MKFKILFSIVCVIMVAGVIGTVTFKSQSDTDLRLLTASNQQLTSTKAQLATEEANLAQTQTNLNTDNNQLSTMKDTLASTQSSLASTQVALTSTQDQLTSANNQITADTSQLSSDASQISSDESNLSSDSSQIATDKSQLDFFNQTYQYQLKIGEQPPYQEPVQVNGNWTTANINLASNPNATEPTFAQLKEFLLSDKNIDQPYTDSEVECTNYAATVYNDCEKAGIKAYFVVLLFSVGAPAL